MKKTFTAILAILMSVILVACKDDEPIKMNLTFEEAEISIIEVYHKNSATNSCERIVVSDRADIQKIYHELSDIVLEEREIDNSDYVIGLDAVSIRIILVDGTKFDVSFANQGEGGFISFTSGDAQYYTQMKVSSSWAPLKEQYECESVGMDEMP